MCESASDATYVTNYLTEKGIDTLVAHENTEIEHFKS